MTRVDALRLTSYSLESRSILKRSLDKTLLKGLGLLEALAVSETPRGVSDLARELLLTRSNVHRTLRTMCAAGYVRQHPDSGDYECTLKLFQLGGAVLARLDVKRTAEPFMEMLASRTRETVHLSVLDDTDVIYLHKIDSPQPVRAYSAIGGRAPAYAVATGKALLAFQGEGYLDRFRSRLRRHAPRTLVTLAALRRELDQIRRQGYAVNRGEWRESVCGLAAPVFDSTGFPLAAVGISGPIERLKPAVLRSFRPDVVQSARSISEALGYAAQ